MKDTTAEYEKALEKLRIMLAARNSGKLDFEDSEEILAKAAQWAAIATAFKPVK